MKYWQRNYEASAQALTLNNIDTVPAPHLPDAGFLGSLLLRFSGSEVSGQGQSGGTWRILDYISKIEVLLNESVVCKSLSAKVVKALTFLDQGVYPKGRWQNYASGTQWDWLLINFGRRMFDQDYGLDLSKYDSVKLRITNTATSSTWSDITVAAIGIYQKDTAGPVASRGYLRTEEWKSWTTVADETIYSDLPTEYIIRRILLQAIPSLDANNLNATGMHNLMDSILMSLKTKDITVFSGALQELMRENHLDLGKELITAGAEYMTAGKGVDVGIGYVSGGAWAAGASGSTGASTVPSWEAARTDHVQKPATYEADHPSNFIFTGIAPEECAFFRFDQQDDPATWLDPAEMKTVKCDIHTRNSSSAASGTNKIILDRLVKY
jgi:hypothetical protein